MHRSQMTTPEDDPRIRAEYRAQAQHDAAAEEAEQLVASWQGGKTGDDLAEHMDPVDWQELGEDLLVEVNRLAAARTPEEREQVIARILHERSLLADRIRDRVLARWQDDDY